MMYQVSPAWTASQLAGRSSGRLARSSGGREGVGVGVIVVVGAGVGVRVGSSVRVGVAVAGMGVRAGAQADRTIQQTSRRGLVYFRNILTSVVYG